MTAEEMHELIEDILNNNTPEDVPHSCQRVGQFLRKGFSLRGL